MIPVTLQAVTDSDILFFGEDWYFKLISLGIDGYLREEHQVMPITSDTDWWVFVPIKNDGGMFGVFFPVPDVIAFEATEDVQNLYRNARVTYLEEKYFTD